MNIHKTLALVVVASAWAAAAGAQVTPAGPTTRDARNPGAHGQEALSPTQVAKVKAVLAQYKADSLSVDDAKAIKRALRDAGMRPSPALDQALRAEGFSAERLDQLDPRPPGPPGGGEYPRREGIGGASDRPATKAPQS
jgi:hypothetical protein